MRFRCRSIDASLLFSFFQYIPSNNPLFLTLPILPLPPALSFLPTRDKSAPCCDSIVRLFHINLTAGINQCDSSSVIPKEIPRYIRVEGPFDPRKIHRVSLMASCMLVCVRALYARVLHLARP